MTCGGSRLTGRGAHLLLLSTVLVAACRSSGTEPEFDALAISTTSLSSGVEGVAYSASLSATGGNGSYTWSVASGALPAGLSLAANGAVSGTPTAAETGDFTVMVESGDGQTDTRSLSITVNAVLEITTGSLPNGLEGSDYDQALAATGGDGSYAWSVASGTLPAGLSLGASSGRIVGTPGASGQATFTVHVESGDGQSAEAELTLTVLGILEVATSTLPAVVVGTAYAQTLVANGGEAPYSWSIATDTLASGLSLNPATGEISGTPSSAGTVTFTVQVDSDDGQTAQQELSLTVHAVLAITTSALPSGAESVAYDESATATGGDGSYTWSIPSGSLPGGLTLDASTGRISGTPSATEVAAFTLRVESGDGQLAEADLSITILGKLVITTASLRNGVEGVVYADTLAAQGGDGSYAWSVAADTLPSGLSLDSATGEISGTPTAQGTASFTVQVDSGDGQSDTQALSISVYAPLAITTGSLPGAVQGVPYDETVSATGGDGTYVWSVSAGALPDGIALGPSSGSVTGTPTTVETASFTLEVASGDGQVADQGFSIGVELLILGAGELCSENPSTAVATFADANLESVVRQQLGVSPSTDLTCALVATASGLDGGSAGISDLTGIQNLTGLTTAYLVGNSFADLTPLGALTQLESLNLSGNALTDLSPLVGLSSLTLLIADGIGVGDLTGLEGMTSLDRLELDNNVIADLTPLSGLASLRILELGNNSISDLSPLSGLTSLESLHLSSNSIGDVGPLASLTSLVTLDLQFNSIADVTALAGLTSLQTLRIYFNAVADLSPLSGLTSLTFLHAQANLITDIGPVAGMTSLERLAVNSNDVTSVAALGSLANLRMIDVSANSGLSDIQPLLDNPAVAVGDTVRLWTTDITCAEIGSLEAKGVTVYSDCLAPYQYCASNTTAIATFEDANLESAVRTALGLTTDDVLRCGLVQSLDTLDVSSSGITSIAGIQNADGLIQLVLSDNGISDVQWLNRLTILEDLQLSQNSVTGISSLVGLTSLANVLLDDNATLANINPLIDNTGIGPGDTIDLTNTAVSCTDVGTLRATGATVIAPACPP